MSCLSLMISWLLSSHERWFLVPASARLLLLLHLLLTERFSRLDWLAAACVMVVSQLCPISAQGDLVSCRADPPSQDRRSLGYLVSSPPLATDHGSRLHQLSDGAACRLSGSRHLDMTRPQRIAVTAFLSALFVPSLFLLPFWCLKSEGMRSVLWDLSSSAPPLVNTVVAGAIPLIVFGVLCSVFAWVVARIWR